jgi:hypothetical protein
MLLINSDPELDKHANSYLARQNTIAAGGPSSTYFLDLAFHSA